jgi:predicted GNAT family N-acyltransferase
MSTTPSTGAIIREADFRTEEATIRAIRFNVFVDEQNVPAGIEMDDRDPHCIHLLALLNEEPIGTARIDIEKSGKIGRLAVLASYRRRGVGRELMERCHVIAHAHGLDEVWCNAQFVAVPFYEGLGYSVTGGEFEEAGITHLKMTMALE